MRIPNKGTRNFIIVGIQLFLPSQENTVEFMIGGLASDPQGLFSCSIMSTAPDTSMTFLLALPKNQLRITWQDLLYDGNRIKIPQRHFKGVSKLLLFVA